MRMKTNLYKKSASVTKNKRRSDIKGNRFLLVMLIPGLVVMFFNNYLPMAGIVMAFQKINFKKFAFFGDWVGLSNLKAFFKSTYAPVIHFLPYCTYETRYYRAVQHRWCCI